MTSHFYPLCGHGGQGAAHLVLEAWAMGLFSFPTPPPPTHTVSDALAAAARACWSNCCSSAPKAHRVGSSRRWPSSRASALAWSGPQDVLSRADCCSSSHAAASAASAKYCGQKGGVGAGPRTLCPAAHRLPPGYLLDEQGCLQPRTLSRHLGPELLPQVLHRFCTLPGIWSGQGPACA